MPPYGGNKPRKRPEKPKQTLGEKIFVGFVIVSILGLAALLVWTRQAAGPALPPQPDLASQVADLAPFRSVAPAGAAGWIADVAPEWAAPGAPGALAQLCERAFVRLGGGKGQTLMIVRGEDTLVECEARPPAPIPTLPTPG